MSFLFSSLLMAASLLPAVHGQFPPEPAGLTTLKSQHQPGVTVTYKSGGICETTKGVKSFSGYVHLPNNSLDDVDVTQNYPINTFFWFFEARENPETAPLSIWINGGPGSSSMIGLLQEHGPCRVNADSNSTTLNPYSWNGKTNMLYIDQPDQVGLSYDVLTNGTIDLSENNPNETFVTVDFSSEPVPQQNNSFLVGTRPSGIVENTANNSMNAARSLWHFTQVWFEEFPQYKVDEFKFWTESYGGTYGPTFATFFEQQNKKIENGSFTEQGAYVLKMDTLGIINGCIDEVILEQSYLDILYNNTYGLQIMNDTAYASATEAFYKKGGCQEQLINCRNAADQATSDMNMTAIDICGNATEFCENNVENYIPDTFGVYDIAHPSLDPYPPPYLTGFLNAEYVQDALGVQVNWTSASYAVGNAIGSNLYENRYLETDLAYLLNSGIRVALVYGDRDWICNWYQGENVSLAVDYPGSESFRSAGYTDLKINSSYIGGQTRQYGNFSFSRVYESGHEVPAYQPETALRIFERVNSGMDVATGTKKIDDKFSTTGLQNTLSIKNEVPPRPEVECYTLLLSSCTEEQQYAVTNNTAIVKDYFVVEFGNGTCSPNPIQPCKGEDEYGAPTNSSSGSGNGTATGGSKSPSTLPAVPASASTLSTWWVESIMKLVCLGAGVATVGMYL